MSVRFVDEIESAVGWIESERLQRTSHALSVDDRVWLIDPIEGDGVEERLRAAGEPAGVIQLIDRHNRDGAALASRLGVPLHLVPASLPETPFQFLPVLPGPLVEGGRALVAGAPDPGLRRRDRHDLVLPRGRRARRPASLPAPETPARARWARGRAPARRARRGHPRRGRRRSRRARVANGPPALSPLADGDPAHRPPEVLASETPICSWRSPQVTAER